MPRICPPGMVTVVQPGMTPHSGHENMYIASQDDRQVHVEHVAYFQSREAFQQPNSAARSYEMMRLRTRKETDGQ